jgi:galactoside O-acetyltransferase
MLERLFRSAASWWRELACLMPGGVGYRMRARLLRRRQTGAGAAPWVGPGLGLAGLDNLSFGGSFSAGRDCIFETSAGVIEIGERVGFNHRVLLIADYGRIAIGDDTIIGPNVVMRSANHAFDLDDDRPVRDQGHHPGDIVIGRGAWIGAGVILLAGAVVGDGAVIGAGAVVKSVIPPYSLAAGVPAKVLRQRQPLRREPV